MQGYKLVDKGIKNQYGKEFEFNKKYIYEGEVKYREKGYHFSTYPENTLRFLDSKRPSDFTIVQIEAGGEIDCGDDLQSNEYYGFRGMYTCSEMVLLRVVPREEIFNIILESKTPERMQRYVQLINLTEDEINQIRANYSDFETNAYIDYHEFGDERAFYKYDEFYEKRKQLKNSL